MRSKISNLSKELQKLSKKYKNNSPNMIKILQLKNLIKGVEYEIELLEIAHEFLSTKPELCAHNIHDTILNTMEKYINTLKDDNKIIQKFISKNAELKKFRDIKDIKLLNQYMIMGSQYDTLVGISYLILKYSDKVCNSLKTVWTFQENIQKLHTAIIFGCKEDFSQTLVNKSIKDDKYYLSYPDTLQDTIEDCKKSDKIFLLIPLDIRYREDCKSDRKLTGHENMLIYNLKTDVVERYEPYGFEHMEHQQADYPYENSLNKLLSKVFPKYSNPLLICSKAKGAQAVESVIPMYRTHERLIEGYCTVWSLYYADLRINNPDKNMKEIYQLALERNNFDPQKMRDEIKKFAKLLLDSRKEIIEKAPMNPTLKRNIKEYFNYT